MSKTSIVKLLVYILQSMVEHGQDLIALLFGKGDIKDSELYKRLPRKRQIELLREFRRAQRLVKAK